MTDIPVSDTDLIDPVITMDEIRARLDSIEQTQQEILNVLESASRALSQAQAYLPMLSGLMGNGNGKR